MLEKLKEIKKKYEALQASLSDPEIVQNIELMTKNSRELKQLEPIIEKLKEYEANLQENQEAKELLQEETDEDMKEMLKETVSQTTTAIETDEEELKILLLPKDPNDGKNAILEIRGAAGGDEANIFAGDLYRMYVKFAEIQGWKVQVLETNESDSGGFTLVQVLVQGEDVFSKLKFESGSHRVQRVPATESQGRIHTSTATVIVMPELDDVEVEIKEAEIRVDTYRSSGAGGQSVNTTDSAVRITHLPTDIVVSCQTERSQIQNKERAMKVLRSKLYEYYLEEQQSENDQLRRQKLGSGDRSEKIRTYNYPQNRVTDHRIGFTVNKLDQVMEGKLIEVIDALLVEEQMEKLQAIE